MKLEPKEIAEGKYIGQELWVCDCFYNGFHTTPLRYVRPTKVKCLSKEETDKKLWKSECFFREGNKKSSVIKLYHNTTRGFSDRPLHVFTTEEECRIYFTNLQKSYYPKFQDYKKYQLRLLYELEKNLTT
jgi:hypothetical protein